MAGEHQYNTCPPVDNKVDIPIVIPYCNKSNTLGQHWKTFICKNSKFSQARLITAFSISGNLRKKLVSSRLINRPNFHVRSKQITDSKSNATSKTTGVFKCMDKHCRSCQHINVGKHFTSILNKRNFDILSVSILLVNLITWCI